MSRGLGDVYKRQGAVMLFPLLDMAMRVYRENTTFEDIQIEAYEDYKKC